MEEIKQIFDIVINSWIFKTITGTIFITLVGWAMMSIKNTSKKIQDSPSKDDLEKGICSAKKYTDDKIRYHEKEHKTIQENFEDIKKDNVRIETKVDKILFLLAKH